MWRKTHTSAAIERVRMIEWLGRALRGGWRSRDPSGSFSCRRRRRCTSEYITLRSDPFASLFPASMDGRKKKKKEVKEEDITRDTNPDTCVFSRKFVNSYL